MSGQESGRFDFYEAQYARFAGELAREMRREVYGVDLGQQEKEEGAAFFDKRQRFLATTSELAGSGRLSRYLYAAEKPS